MIRFALALIVGLGAAAGFGFQATDPAPPAAVQAEPVKAEGAKAEAVKSDPANAATTQADSPKANATTPVVRPTVTPEEFPALFEQWKKLLGELRTLQAKYSHTVNQDERKKIEADFQKLVAQGESMQAKIAAGAEAAFLADPLKNRDAERFLASQAQSSFNRDDFAEAARLAMTLADKGYKNPVIFRIAGVALFNLHDFEQARNYLKQADDAGGLDEESRHLLNSISNYIAYWRVEEELRVKEAAADDLPRVLLKTTKGDIEIELFENEAPNTVANFISLVEKGFYNNLIFHRVLPGFMAQGGCPQGSGMGGPGYSFADECYQPNFRRHFTGSLSMANSGRDTNGSQFFLTFRPTGHLDGRHTVFGRVVKGLDILPKLQRVDPNQPNPTIKPDRILEAKVLRKREHPYLVRKLGDPEPPASTPTPDNTPKSPAETPVATTEPTKQPEGEKKPDDGKKTNGGKQPEGEKKPDGEKQPEPTKQPEIEKQPGGEKQADGEKQPGGEKQPAVQNLPADPQPEDKKPKAEKDPEAN